MKRDRDERTADDSNRAQTTKRPKSSQACTSCRKHKTRCELIDGITAGGSLRCHRCNVLNLQCSFDSGDFPIPSSIPSSSREPAHTPTPRAYPRDEVTPKHTPSTESHYTPNCATDGIDPEDLVPTPNTPWGFQKTPGGHDWTATPMLAMQELARRANISDGALPLNVYDYNAALINILTPDQLRFLLDIFETRYSPWVNLPSHQDVNSSLVNMARCVVASRHLDPVTRSRIVPQLLRVLESTVPKLLFNPIPSTESIHAVIIFSMWVPVDQPPGRDYWDARLLAATGASLAMNLRLSQASVYVNSLREQGKRDSVFMKEKASELDDAMDKARLWLCLSNVESMLCLGTGRAPLSQRSETDLNVIDSSSFATSGLGRDMRLGLLAQLLELTEHATRIRLNAYADLYNWYKEITEVLLKMERLCRLIVPLPVVVDHDIFYYHMMQVWYHVCRLLVLHVYIRAARSVVARECACSEHQPWYTFLEANGINIIAFLGQDAIRSAEAVMVAMLIPEVSLLGTAPDNVFSMVGFAAAFLIMTKFAVLQNMGEILEGASEHLLNKIIDRFRKAAYTSDHAPAKCASLIAAMVATWDRRTAKDAKPKESYTPEYENSTERISPLKAVIPDASGHTSFSHPGHDPILPSFSSNSDLNRFMNSDIFLDTDFWGSFMSKLTTETSM